MIEGTSWGSEHGFRFTMEKEAPKETKKAYPVFEIAIL